jgi:response regulator RpfG family c-di-GMP phosphodiesterase
VKNKPTNAVDCAVMRLLVRLEGRENSGEHFDPQVVKSFFDVIQEISYA